MSDKATRISALMDELLKVSSDGLTDCEQGLLKEYLTKMQKMSPELLKLLNQLSDSCANQATETIKDNSFAMPEANDLISRACLVHELNHSHFPGAPYVDAGISIAIGKVMEAPPVTTYPNWIPCELELPKSKEEDLEYPTVAVTLRNGDVTLACYYESTGEWGAGENFDKLCFPVAWTPLPKAYKIEDKG